MWPIVNSFLLELCVLFLLSAGFFLIHRTAKFLNIAHTDYATLSVYLIWTIAVGLEWLRFRGLSAAEVQNKVKVYKQNNLDKRETAVLKGVQRQIRDYSNPKARKLADTVVIG